ncbi:unnamed protein product [Closterium sp. Yama58-4]|nr:unnamed protein product [Closterium sp. Yama58-4]
MDQGKARAEEVCCAPCSPQPVAVFPRSSASSSGAVEQAQELSASAIPRINSQRHCHPHSHHHHHHHSHHHHHHHSHHQSTTKTTT